MGREDEAVLPLTPELADQHLHPGRVGRVQVRGRLVERDHLGPHREDARERGEPLLAAREVGRDPVREPGRTDRLERLERCRPRLFGGEPQVHRPERDVLDHGGGEELAVRVLEDHADRPPELPPPGVVHGLAADLDPPLLGHQRPVQVLDQGRLARAVRAADRDDLAPVHGEAHRVQPDRAVGVDVARAVDVDQGGPVARAAAERRLHGAPPARPGRPAAAAAPSRTNAIATAASCTRDGGGSGSAGANRPA